MDNRQEDLKRLSYPSTNINDPMYIKYTFLFADLKTVINKYAKGKLLDIGCGNKPYYPLFEGKLESYIGCDIIQSDKHLVDILCPATDIPLESNTMDTVFSTQVMEHVADHKKLVTEAFRILKPGGYFLASAPMIEEHHEEPYDFFRFTKYGFDYLLTEAGFTDIEIIPNGGKWAMIGHQFHVTLRTSMYGKKGFGRKILKGFYFIFRIKWLISWFFLWLDKIDKDYNATMNFVVAAKKP